MVDELVVSGEMGETGERDIVICFEDLLRTGVRQLAVANDPAQPAGGEIELALVRDPVDCAGQSDGVVRPSPA